MKANEMDRDELAAFVESDEGRAFLYEQDSHWEEATRVARERGFIVQACGGAATLCTYDAMREFSGTEGVVRMLQMSGIDIPV